MLARQGDILFVKLNEQIDLSGAQLRPDGVIARGEVTGHAHRVDTSKAQVLTLERSEYKFDILKVLENAPVWHEEHQTVQLEPGLYWIRRQRELDESMRWRYISD